MKTTRNILSCGLLTVSLLALIGLVSSALAQEVAVVQAASFAKDGGTGTTAGSGIVTPNGLASAFGTFNVTAGQTSYAAPSGQPLPKVLGGVRVKIGTSDADLLFTSATQINFLVPSNAVTGGIQDITVTNADNSTRTGKVRVESFGPGLFSAKASGTGVAAANWTTTGVQPYPDVFAIVNGQPTHVDLDAGTKAKPSYLVLYATGLRGAPNTNTANDLPGLVNVAESCTVTIQGVPAQVDYAGAQGSYFGLDQINAVIPPELSGFGILNVRLEVKSGATSRISNDVEIKLGGGFTTLPILKDLTLAGETVAGQLSTDDPVEMPYTDNPNDPYYRKLYFIDLYRFRTTAPNTTVAIDLRANLAATDPLDTQIVLRKGSSQTFFAADDQGGGYGSCPNPPGNCKPLEVNNNSLLLAVLPEVDDYYIFVTSSDFAPVDTGSYTLKFSTNVLTPLTYGQTVNSSFSATTKIQTAAGVYVDGYYFTGREGENIRLTMRSTALDSFLRLLERDGDEIALNDNGGGPPPNGLDAQITQILPVNSRLPLTRPFIIVATPLANNVTGAYTIQLEKLSGFTEAAAEAAPASNAPERAANVREPRRMPAARAMWRRPVPKEQ